MADLQITEAEYANLMRSATNGRVVMCTFGAGRVDLRDTPENAWARQQIEDARKALGPAYFPFVISNGHPVRMSTD